ncbi:MAG: DNA/RNA nuclease SfsA [Nitrospirae bacterium]|nr:DNA/RNA nuclease SfsA [Nitrospirota bacterium]
MRVFEDTVKAYFRERINRFVISCESNGKTIEAYLPNPGRLWELLLPGRSVYLVRNNTSTGYTAVAVKKDNSIVMLHTHKVNDVAQWLIENNRVPGLEGYRVERREYTHGKSRFDFLLRRHKRSLLLEVKSCTLFHKGIAMFPDAETKRGLRHLEELSEVRKTGKEAGVLFLVSTDEAEYFLPEYHTDIDFSLSLYKNRGGLFIEALSLRWNNDLELDSVVKPLRIPWQILDREMVDSGAYMVVLFIEKDKSVRIGTLGDILFKKGYYVYVGSAEKGLKARMERHKRRRKKVHWHIDYLRNHCEIVTVLPVRSSERLECLMARDIRMIAQGTIKGFGSSDCRCKGHLYYLSELPIRNKKFIDILLDYRIGRLRSRICQR